MELSAVSHSPTQLEQLASQPGAALGSGRDLLEDGGISQILYSLGQRNISTVFVIGGNGTMAAGGKLHEASVQNSSAGSTTALRVIGIPKTIDNDLPGTDVCPGYGSTARFLAHAVHDASLDLHSMRRFDDIVVFESMGRHTGWLAAAAALGGWSPDAAPHLILLPEVPFDEEAFLQRVAERHQHTGTCFVVTAEGIRDSAGVFLAEKTQAVQRDDSGQKLLALSGGPAPYLVSLIQQRLKLRCRTIRPDTLQRSTSSLASPLDREIAYGSGRFAAEAAAVPNGGAAQGAMVSIRLEGQQPSYNLLAFDQLQRGERHLPQEFIDAARFNVTEAFRAYATRLAAPLPAHPILF